MLESKVAIIRPPSFVKLSRSFGPVEDKPGHSEMIMNIVHSCQHLSFDSSLTSNLQEQINANSNYLLNKLSLLEIFRKELKFSSNAFKPETQ